MIKILEFDEGLGDISLGGDETENDRKQELRSDMFALGFPDTLVASKANDNDGPRPTLILHNFLVIF